MTNPDYLHASDDIQWMAFRYLADELDSDQREWFESLLAEDQDAREALAEAVEIADAVVVAEDLVQTATAKPSSPLRVHALWWMTAGAALCLTVMFVAKSINQPVAKGVAEGQSIDSASLAVAWDQTRSLMLEQTELPPVPMLEEDDELVDLTGPAIDEDPAPPSWMESALLGMSDADEDDEEWEG